MHVLTLDLASGCCVESSRVANSRTALGRLLQASAAAMLPPALLNKLHKVLPCSRRAARFCKTGAQTLRVVSAFQLDCGSHSALCLK